MADSVSLRPPSENDFPALLQIRDDLATQHALMSYPHLDALGSRHWLQRKLSSAEDRFLSIILESGEAVGFIQFTNIHFAGKRADMGIAIHPRSRARGLGKLATREALHFAIRDLALHKILLEVRADNEVGISVYEASGFTEVGVLKDHYHDGERWHDVSLMQCLL